MGEADVEVAAGLVLHEGRMLIAQRCEGTHLEGLWEFPGGKRKIGESLAACVRRELLEELGIEVEVGREIEHLRHEYPEKTVCLHFLQCRWMAGTPQALDCADWAWITVEDLKRYDFPAADARLLERLRREPALWQWGDPTDSVASRIR